MSENVGQEEFGFFSEGFCKLSRKILEIPLKDYEIGIYCWLLLKASYKSGIIIRNTTLKKGQFIIINKEIEERFKRTPQEIRNVLKRLCNFGLISKNATNKHTIITICNYYDNDDELEGHQQTRNKQGTNKEQTKNKHKEKEGKEGIEREERIESNSYGLDVQKAGHEDEEIGQSEANASSLEKVKEKKIQLKIPDQYEKEFEEFYGSYPRKKARENAWKAYLKARREKIPHETIMRGVENYKGEIQRKKTESQYIAHPATWLNRKSWEDETEGNAEGIVSGETQLPAYLQEYAAIAKRMGAV